MGKIIVGWFGGSCAGAAVAVFTTLILRLPIWAAFVVGLMCGISGSCAGIWLAVRADDR